LEGRSIISVLADGICVIVDRASFGKAIR
jgi:hypothetical protein